MSQSPCPFCGRVAAKSSLPDATQVDCEQCGHFVLTGTAEKTTASLDPRLKMKIGFWTRDQNGLGDTPRVTSFTIDDIKKLPDLTVMRRAERLLRWAIGEQKDLGGIVKLPSGSAAGITHSRSNPEVIALARLLHENGWLYENYTNGMAQVSPQGFMHASEANVTLQPAEIVVTDGAVFLSNKLLLGDAG